MCIYIYTCTRIFLTQRRAHAEVLKKEQFNCGQQSMSLFAHHQKSYDAKHPKQKQVTDALVDFIAEDLMPLHLVDSPRFQKLLKSLDPQYSLPSRKHLSTTLLTKKYDHLKAN